MERMVPGRALGPGSDPSNIQMLFLLSGTRLLKPKWK